MSRSRLLWRLSWFLPFAVGLGGAGGCANVEITPLVPANAPFANDRNPVYIPLENYGKVYENCLEVLGDFGFEFVETNRYDGRIETKPRVAPGLLLFLKPGSPDLYERTLATAQSYRHRVGFILHPAEQGGFFIEVVARKELEDLPRPVRSLIGPAAFRTEVDLDRTSEVIDENAFEAVWIFKGRDVALEQELIRRLKRRM